MRRKQGKCEVCETRRALTRYRICDECWQAQDHTQGENDFATKIFTASHSLADIQKAQPEDVYGLHSGRTKEEK